MSNEGTPQTPEAQAQPPLTREAARSEMARAMSDPQHPMYAAAQRGLPMFDAWADALYKRIPGSDAKVEFGGSMVVADGTGDTAEADAAFRASVDTVIAERGIDIASVHAESAKLFGGAGGAVLDLLDERTLLGLAPEAKRDAHIHMAQYLADLAQLRGSAAPGGDAPAPDDFQASYVAALQGRGIDVRTLDETLNNLFGDKPEAYEHFVKHLDSFPPAARLAAYVRSAEAVMMFSRLAQSVS